MRFWSTFEAVWYKGAVWAHCYFWIFINDITDFFHLPLKCKMHADDVTLYTEIKSIKDVLCFQSILNRVYSWPVTCSLQFLVRNVISSVLVSRLPTVFIDCQYFLGYEHVTISASMSHLGVVIDRGLCFSDHISKKISSKVHQRACLILCCFTSKDRNLLVKALTTYVRPLLEYNIQIWSPTSKRYSSHMGRATKVHQTISWFCQSSLIICGLKL